MASVAARRRARSHASAGKRVDKSAADATFALQKDNIAQLAEISRNSQTTFLALLVACVYSMLTIATTTDATLLANSNATPLPIIQVNVPIVAFYVVAPIILTVLFVYFHLYLAHFWRGVAKLPVEHPDDRRGLDDYVYPWLISCAIIRGGICRLSRSHRLSASLEAGLSLLLGWWLVPAVLLLYWGRYAAAHDRWVTALHIGLFLFSVAFALHCQFTAQNAVASLDRDPPDGAQASAAVAEASLGPSGRQLRRSGVLLLLLASGLVYLSVAAFRSLFEGDCGRIEDSTACARYAPGLAIWKQLPAVDPNFVVREGRFVTKPGDWQELVSKPEALRNYLLGQRGLVLVGRDLRNMDAFDAFMPGSQFNAANLDFADLSHAVMTGSRFDGVTLRGARLVDAVLHHAEIADSRFEDVAAEAAQFDNVRFRASGPPRYTGLSGNFSGASFDRAQADQLRITGGADGKDLTSLRGASLREVVFNETRFERVDLGTAPIEDASIAHSRFVETDFSGATIYRSSMNFSEFDRCRFIATDIRDSMFEESRFLDTEFDGAEAPASLGGNLPGPLPREQRKRIERFQAPWATFDNKTRLRNLEFVRAELRSARFEGTKLSNTLFSSSDLADATFADVDLSDVDFQAVDLSGANLSTARNLRPSQLEGACGNAKTRLPPDRAVKPCLPGGAR